MRRIDGATSGLAGCLKWIETKSIEKDALQSAAST
jgi:hypothetical protein